MNSINFKEVFKLHFRSKSYLKQQTKLSKINQRILASPNNQSSLNSLTRPKNQELLTASIHLLFRDSNKTDPERFLKMIPNLMMKLKLSNDPKNVSKEAHGKLSEREIKLRLLPIMHLSILLMIRILSSKVLGPI